MYNLLRLSKDPYYSKQWIKFWIYITNWCLILLNGRLIMGALFLTEASMPTLNAEKFQTTGHSSWMRIGSGIIQHAF